MSQFPPSSTPAGPASVAGTFRPARWLASRHLQTIGAALLPCPSPPPLDRELFRLPDGDVVAADWVLPRQSPGHPLVVVLHGLEGSSESRYAQRLAAALIPVGWQMVVLHARGCGGTPNRLPRGYHAGETRDLGAFLDAVRADGWQHVVAVGYSLGGNVLLKYLGEKGTEAGLDGAVAVSVPYDLADAASAVDRGFSRLYRDRLLTLMKRRLREAILSGRLAPRWSAALSARDFRSFDDLFTAPAHGFAGVDDYYARCSARRHLAGIRTPALLISARDDPFMTPASLPDPSSLPGCVELEVCEAGGHVGFISGGAPWRPEYWLERRVIEFLERQLPAPEPETKRGGTRPGSRPDHTSP